LWPFGVVDHGPVRVLEFLCGKYANLNFGVWNRDFAASATRVEIEAVFDCIAQNDQAIDLLALYRQPKTWNGVANPFALLPHQPSSNDGRRIDLRRQGPNTTTAQLRGALRKQLRTKEHRLSQLPGYRYLRATAGADADRLLDWFFHVKSEHLAAQGVANVFAERGIQRFLREACNHGLAAGEPLVEVHALQTRDETLAMIAGVGDGTRFSSILTTYTLSDRARHSPGLVLVHHVIGNLAARGYAAFDLGVGDARYKRLFCKQAEPLFDSFIPLTPLGWAAGVVARSCSALVRGIKRRPALWSAAQTARRHIHGRR
jgi:CelD/BcsL family acetyltransferase involved in cellulose biosynthesis